MQLRDTSGCLWVTFSKTPLVATFLLSVSVSCFLYQMFLGSIFFLNLRFNSPKRLAVCERENLSYLPASRWLHVLPHDPNAPSHLLNMPAALAHCLQLQVCSEADLMAVCCISVQSAPSVCSEEKAHLSNWKETQKTLSSPTQLKKSHPAAFTPTMLIGSYSN